MSQELSHIALFYSHNTSVLLAGSTYVICVFFRRIKRLIPLPDWMLVFRLVIPAYLVMSLSQFVTYLLMLIVKEKERKTEETLKIAGLRNSVFWYI